MVVLRDGDYMKTIISYIERNMGRGYNLDQIRFTLMQHGYSRAAIDRGIRVFQQTHPPKKEVAPITVQPEVVPEVHPVVEQKKGLISKLFGFFERKPKIEQSINSSVN